MPLECLPDRFDDATHRELDKAVNETAQRIGFSGPLILPFQCLLLSYIIDHSKGDLDPKYCLPRESEILINTHGELRDYLLSTWEKKSYREIRNLAILKAPKSTQNVSEFNAVVGSTLNQSLSSSFHEEYRGAAVDGFYEYLTYNEKLFRVSDDPLYYAKFCSIVQSSGTGKSRMLTELGKKDVIVIYMNTRDKDDKLSFPPRDPIPSDILTRFPGGEGEYMATCYAFFIALFDVVEEQLSTSHATRGAKADIMRWVRQMCDMSDPPKSTARADFFEKLAHKYKKAHVDLLRAVNKRLNEIPKISVAGEDKAGPETVDTKVDETANKLANLSLSESKQKELRAAELTQPLRDSFLRLAASLERLFPEHSTKPKLVIAIDEAHPLTPELRDYRPADVLCRVVKKYSHFENRRHAVWVALASTTSKVADFSPPNKKHNSHRVAIDGERLFPPYTQLGWDQSAAPLGDVDPENISLANHIIGYGRPLWLSLKNALGGADEVLKTASEKLCDTKYDTGKIDHVLAVMGQRFAVSVVFGHPDSVEHLESGVASHMRICLATTMDRTWRFTSYPSEPFLSCAAARVLHGAADNLEGSLKKLLNLINNGMIDMGQRGELASRLLWLLAKDLFVRSREKPDTKDLSWDGHLIDCEMIPVVDWLEFVFGPRVWDEDNTQASLARETFQNAYLNFSHWLCMDADIAGSKEENELPLDVWTLRHWQRTSAVQCFHGQPRIDKVIPIYFKGGPTSGPARERMSQIFISDKARESSGSKPTLHDITRRHKSIGGEGAALDDGVFPYIAILADLSRPTSFSVTFPERNVRDRCLRIYASGVDTTTYPFLSRYPAVMGTLENLVHLQRVPRSERFYNKYLDAQVKFGSTSTAEHMEWERGRNVPTLPRNVG